MSRLLNQWRVIVTATQLEDFVWREETEGAPVVSSTGAAIDTAKSRIYYTIDMNEVKIQEEETPTGGHFYVEQRKCSCPANQTSTHITSFDIDINVISTSVTTITDMTGDYMKWVVSPQTTVGYATTSIATNDTTINVNSTVTTYVKKGFEVRIADSGNPTGTYQDMGRVINVDTDNNQLTFGTSISQSFGTGSLIQMTIPFMEGYIGYPSLYEYGKDKIGTSFLPANTPIYLYYTNNSPATDKDLYIQFQYLY